MKKIFLSIILGLAAASALYAADDAGSVAMPFVNVPHNPVTLGEGGVYMARSSSLAYGALENIASLPLSASKVDIAFSYEMWTPKQADEKFVSFGAGMNLGRLAFSLSGSLGNNDPYVEYREGGFEGSKFTPKDMTLALGLSYGVSDAIAIGVNAKYLSNTLTSQASYTAFCLDLMGYGRFGALAVGAGLRNIGPKVKSYSGDEFSLPASVAAGISYESAAGFGAEADLDFVFGAGADVSAGAHYCWNDMITVRAGYHLGAILPSYLSVGGGFKIFGVCIDAAYVLSSDNAAGSMCLGLGYRF